MSLYRVNGDFLKILDEIGYHFCDEDGTVYVFDICVEGPTNPNECISGSFDETVEMTMLIPTTPKMADEPVSLGTVAKVGVPACLAGLSANDNFSTKAASGIGAEG